MPETETWRYRGQTIDREQIAFLREFIRQHPDSSRWKLSRQLCEALGWKQANGALRDVVCRGLLLMLERGGEIELPAVRRHIRGQRRTARPRPEAVLIDTTPLTMPLEAEPMSLPAAPSVLNVRIIPVTVPRRPRRGAAVMHVSRVAMPCW